MEKHHALVRQLTGLQTQIITLFVKILNATAETFFKSALSLKQLISMQPSIHPVSYLLGT